MTVGLVVLYVLFGLGFAAGRRERGATLGGAVVAFALWPVILGYLLGRL